MPTSQTPPLRTAVVSDVRTANADENRLIWIIWMTYGAFYFCRTNISAAVPGMKAPLSAGGLGLDPVQVGVILAALKVCYGLGQLVNGQLSERVSPRLLLAIGMFGSALLNVCLGLAAGFYFLLFVWACNGYCQSLGWTPCVRVVGNWIPVSWRGRALGIIGPGYQVTLGLTYLVAAYSAQWFGWRGALFVPAGVLIVAGIATLFLLRETPAEVATKTPIEGDGQCALPVQRGFSENLYLTLYNPTLWLLGLSLGLLNACRYGFLDWGLTHLMEVQQTTIGKAGLKYCVIALGAVLGSYCAGVATDRLFGGRRAPVICLLLVLLGLLTLLYESVSRSSASGTIVLLAVIGFCIYGPQVLLVGTAPADLAHKGTAAAAAGFVNFMGYMGAATGDVVTGYYSVAEHGGWRIAISIWAGWALAAAVAAGLLWNVTASQRKLLAGWIPVAVGVSVLLVSAALVFRVTGVHWVVITASGGAVLLPVARHLEPRLACFTGVMSLIGLLGLLLGWVPEDGLSSWYTVLPRVGHGLGALAALMVIVEKR